MRTLTHLYLFRTLLVHAYCKLGNQPSPPKSGSKNCLIKHENWKDVSTSPLLLLKRIWTGERSNFGSRSWLEQLCGSLVVQTARHSVLRELPWLEARFRPLLVRYPTLSPPRATPSLLWTRCEACKLPCNGNPRFQATTVETADRILGVSVASFHRTLQQEEIKQESQHPLLPLRAGARLPETIALVELGLHRLLSPKSRNSSSCSKSSSKF